MLRSFPASSGEGKKFCPSSHTAPAASHALQASKGHAGRHGGDSKRHRQKPRLKRQGCLQGRINANPPQRSSLMFLVAGRRHRPGTTHHTAREIQPSPPHTVTGESRSLSEFEPCRLCQAACPLPHPRDSAGLLPRKTVQEQTGRTAFPYPTQCFVVLMSSHREVCTTILPLQGMDRGSPAPPQSGFTEASKPGRASTTRKGFLASTMCWGQVYSALDGHWP